MITRLPNNYMEWTNISTWIAVIISVSILSSLQLADVLQVWCPVQATISFVPEPAPQLLTVDLQKVCEDDSVENLTATQHLVQGRTWTDVHQQLTTNITWEKRRGGGETLTKNANVQKVSILQSVHCALCFCNHKEWIVINYFPFWSKHPTKVTPTFHFTDLVSNKLDRLFCLQTFAADNKLIFIWWFLISGGDRR